MAKWRYKIESLPDDASNRAWKTISELGSDGWELVSVIDGGGEHIAYFKRPAHRVRRKSPSL